MLEIPVYGVCSLDVLAVEAAATGAVAGDFVVATDARRKEVYLATYDDDRRRAPPTPSSTSRPSWPPTLPAVGEGAILYPDHFPSRTGPTRPSAGWLARCIAEERAELCDPEPLYLRRPDAMAPSTPKRVS